MQSLGCFQCSLCPSPPPGAALPESRCLVGSTCWLLASLDSPVSEPASEGFGHLWVQDLRGVLLIPLNSLRLLGAWGRVGSITEPLSVRVSAVLSGGARQVQNSPMSVQTTPGSFCSPSGALRALCHYVLSLLSLPSQPARADLLLCFLSLLWLGNSCSGVTNAPPGQRQVLALSIHREQLCNQRPEQWKTLFFWSLKLANKSQDR